MNTRLFLYKLEDIKVSSIIKGARHLFSPDKATMDLNQSHSKNYNKTTFFESKFIKESSNILEKNDNDGSKKTLPKKQYSDSASARREEIRIRREQANNIAQGRLRAGLMNSGEINFDANSSSQIGNNRIREDLRIYQASLELPPILDNSYYNINFVRSATNNPPAMEPPVTDNYNPLNRANNSQNNSQANSNSSNNNQGNTNDNYANNNQDSNNANNR